MEEAIRRAPRSFDDALVRWQTLYRAALTEFEVQNRRSVDTKVSAYGREEAARRAVLPQLDRSTVRRASATAGGRTVRESDR